jgi:hypothetical protein
VFRAVTQTILDTMKRSQVIKSRTIPVGLLFLGACVGCERKPTSASEGQSERVQSVATSRPVPSAVAVEPTPAPSSSTVPAVTEQPRCLSPAEIEKIEAYDSWRFHGPQRVVRVARKDTLALREGPSPSAAQLAALPYDQGAVFPSKKVCVVGPSDWWEVRVAGKTGWVNSKYLARATTVHDRTAEYKKDGGVMAAKTPWALAHAIVHDMNTPPPEEGRYHAEVIDVQTSGATASAIVYAFGWLDDSIGGEQTLVTMVKTEAGWTVERADTHYLCRRGPGDDPTLCV